MTLNKGIDLVPALHTNPSTPPSYKPSTWTLYDLAQDPPNRDRARKWLPEYALEPLSGSFLSTELREVQAGETYGSWHGCWAGEDQAEEEKEAEGSKKRQAGDEQER